MEQTFSYFKERLQENFKKLSENSDYMFEVAVDKDEFWNLYLDSYPDGTNEIYRERREYDCSCCRQFVKNIGNAVFLDNGVMRTIWDFPNESHKYATVANALSKYIKSKAVTDIYITKEKKIGTDKSREMTDNRVVTWDHFYLELPKKFVHRGSKSVADVKGSFRDIRNVFKRSLDEITEDSVVSVLELISSNSLYKGEEWKTVLNNFLTHKRLYSTLSDKKKEFYAWEQSVKVGSVIGKIRNHSIGTLLVNISENMDLEDAVGKYESIVAPTNYKRPKAIFTKKMLEDAKKTVAELGYMESLPRRFAILDDITVNNILFSNKDSARKMAGDVFDDMSGSVAVNPRNFSRVEEIGINDFVDKVLPLADDIELLLENKLSGNMVSLIAPQNKDSKNMFKWSNQFGWAYKGNITDSSMKDRVKSAGGNVDGVLRFSIQWNDSAAGHDGNDLDAHCIEPGGNEIYYGRKENLQTSGSLDVDIINPMHNTPAVENITWLNISAMGQGKYKMFVENYSHNGGRDGFKAEIEFDGQTYSFEYNKELKQKERVQVAEVTFDRNGGFSIVEKLPSNVSTRDIWGLQSNQFVPVSVMMYSPNYWDLQKGIGHRHYFFMLKDCINSEAPNGFYNEFLKQDLVQHKRVFEALGSKMKVEDSSEQLSGVGFSSTKRNSVLVKVKGQTERVIKIKF